MAITYPLAFPTAQVRTQRLELQHRQAVAESSWTYAKQVVHTSSQWVLQWSWPPMSHANAEAIMAWITSLRGQVGTFTFRPYQSVASTVANKALDAIAYAYTNTVVTSGWTPNSATTLRTGQYIRISGNLFRIIEASATTTADGKATISFEPVLRKNVAAGQPVNFNNPTGIFSLVSSEGFGFTLDPDKLPDLGTFQAREVI